MPIHQLHPTVKSIIGRLEGKDKSLQMIMLNKLSITSEDIRALVQAKIRAGNTTALQLFLTQCNLTDSDMAELENAPFKVLLLDDNKIGNIGAMHLAKNPHVEVLCLPGNQVGDDGAKALARSKVKGLSLANNQVTCIGAEFFKTNTSLQILDLSGNRLKNQGASVFTSTPFQVCLSDNSISPEALAVVSNLVATVSKSQMIFFKMSAIAGGDVPGNKVEQDAMDIFAEIMASNIAASRGEPRGDLLNYLNKIKIKTPATIIKLSNWLINDNDIKILCDWLEGKKCLFYLFLQENKISISGARMLARTINVVSITLSDNQIGDKGASALAENANFIYLDLRRNQLTNIGLATFENSSNLTHFGLCEPEGKITEIGLRHLPRNIKCLDLSGHVLSEEAAKVIADLPALVLLNLSSRLVDKKGLDLLRRKRNLKITEKSNMLEDETWQNLLLNASLVQHAKVHIQQRGQSPRRYYLSQHTPTGSEWRYSEFHNKFWCQTNNLPEAAEAYQNLRPLGARLTRLTDKNDPQVLARGRYGVVVDDFEAKLTENDFTVASKSSVKR